MDILKRAIVGSAGGDGGGPPPPPPPLSLVSSGEHAGMVRLLLNPHPAHGLGSEAIDSRALLSTTAAGQTALMLAVRLGVQPAVWGIRRLAASSNSGSSSDEGVLRLRHLALKGVRPAARRVTGAVDSQGLGVLGHALGRGGAVAIFNAVLSLWQEECGAEEAAQTLCLPPLLLPPSSSSSSGGGGGSGGGSGPLLKPEKGAGGVGEESQGEDNEGEGGEDAQRGAVEGAGGGGRGGETLLKYALSSSATAPNGSILFASLLREGVQVCPLSIHRTIDCTYREREMSFPLAQPSAVSD
jgi:hypothetical protein